MLSTIPFRRAPLLLPGKIGGGAMKVKLCWPWRGVNVIFWFASSLLKVDGKPQVAGPLPDLDCVARVRKSIEAKEA